MRKSPSDQSPSPYLCNSSAVQFALNGQTFVFNLRRIRLGR